MVETTRRSLLALTGGALLMAAGKDQLAWDFNFPSIDGGIVKFSDLKGRVLLVTNTASFCGYTYQYDGLEKLHTARSAAGLTVVGVPSQDFNQESADNAEVKTLLRDPLRHRFSADGDLPCPWRPGRTVLRLGERPKAMATAVELQQGADRP